MGANTSTKSFSSGCDAGLSSFFNSAFAFASTARAIIGSASFPSTSPAWILPSMSTTSLPERDAARASSAVAIGGSATISIGIDRPSTVFPISDRRASGLDLASASSSATTSACLAVALKSDVSATVRRSGVPAGGSPVDPSAVSAHRPRTSAENIDKWNRFMHAPLDLRDVADDRSENDPAYRGFVVVALGVSR